MLHIAKKIEETTSFIRQKWQGTPSAGIILGTGLGGLAEQIKHAVYLPYSDIPHFPKSTAVGHTGQLILGELAGTSVVAMQGRFHLYEGYSAEQVAFPVRLFQSLGANLLIVTNAAGGLNPHYACGDLVVLEDHINWMAANPLIGVNDEKLGPRFPDMCQPYSLELVDKAIAIARAADFTAHRGVYVSMLGPTYETRAEYRYLRQLGGDVVGMSTVPEVITAVHAGMKVLGISTVTNVCLPDALGTTTGEEVAAAAGKAGKRLETIVLGILKDLPRS